MWLIETPWAIPAWSLCCHQRELWCSLFYSLTDRSIRCLTCWLIINFYALIVDSRHSWGLDVQLLSLIKLNTLSVTQFWRNCMNYFTSSCCRLAFMYHSKSCFLICISNVTMCGLMFTFYSCERNSLERPKQTGSVCQSLVDVHSLCHPLKWNFYFRINTLINKAKDQSSQKYIYK